MLSTRGRSPRVDEMVKSVTSELLDDCTGPGFAVIVVPAGAPGGLWTRAGYLHVGDTAEYSLDPAPRALPTDAVEE